MATFAYLRVSTHEQTVENQRLEIVKAGFTPDYFFCDEGVSGSSAAAQRRNSGCCSTASGRARRWW